jgi:hypothetical protein
MISAALNLAGSPRHSRGPSRMSGFNYPIKHMYVIVQSRSGWVLGFGLTPKEAAKDFIRNDLWYDGPPLDTYRCSPALFRRLQAEDRKGSFYSHCRINRRGVAVCPTGRPTASHHRKG